MTILLRYNPALELNLVEYQDVISLAELKALARFSAAHPDVLKSDALNVVQPSADFSAITLPALDDLFGSYRVLFAPLNLEIYRRAAWICLNDAARPYVEHWLAGRDMRKGMSSEVRQFETYAEAADWLVLGPQETPLLESGEGFTEITRFHTPLSAAPTR